MQICTLTVTTSLVITRDMTVLQFSVAAASSTAVFTILGGRTINGNASVAIPVGSSAGTGIYNSAQATTTSPWDNVTISVSAGSVSVTLTQD